MESDQNSIEPIHELIKLYEIYERITIADAIIPPDIKNMEFD